MYRPLFVLLLSLTCVSACQPQSPDLADRYRAARELRAADFSSCERNSTTQFAALVAASRCLIFSVAENPDELSGRQIPLQVLVLPALNIDSLDDPLVILVGGPGQAATESVQIAQIFAQTRQTRDIIFMDQRGTGKLSPLQCDFDEAEPSGLALAEIIRQQMNDARNCLDTLEANPELYTTDLAIKDLEALREYLGYRQFNLWGVSYGTRVAMAYLQAYPDSVRSVIIDGVAPPDIALPLYIERDASNALQAVFTDCEQQEDCNSAYPLLRDHYEQTLIRLATPIELELRGAADNSLNEIELNRDMFVTQLRAPLYSRETQRLIPYIIEEAFQGNYLPLQASASAIAGDINAAMYLSVICNEDIRFINEANLTAEQNNDYVMRSDLFTLPTLEVCQIWPQRDVPADYFEAVESDKPVLVFSGAVDPVTPPRWGQKVADGLSNARHFTVAGFGHGTFNSGCTINIINDFIETTTVVEDDIGCLDNIRRRPFFIQAGGSLSND